jgi:hypothetical protein
MAPLWHAACEVYLTLQSELPRSGVNWPTEKWVTASKEKIFDMHARGRIQDRWQQRNPGHVFPWSDSFVKLVWFTAEALLEADR